MTGCQIVDADRDDRVQDDDLTQVVLGQSVPKRCQRDATTSLSLSSVTSIPSLSFSTIDIVGMRSRPARNYSLYRTSALASIQLLFEVG